jgi:hypothetical protein
MAPRRRQTVRKASKRSSQLDRRHGGFAVVSVPFFLRLNCFSFRQKPFPSNPTFNPPPPLHNDLKESIYEAFVRKVKVKPYMDLENRVDLDEEVIVRELAQQYHISMARVRAIVRLKALERRWKKDVSEHQPPFTIFLA